MNIDIIKPISLEKKIETLLNNQDLILSLRTKQVIKQLIKDSESAQLVVNLMKQRIKIDKKKPSILDGFIYQNIVQQGNQKIQHKLIKNFPNGLMEMESTKMHNYKVLEKLLIHEKFQEADQLTQISLCKLVESKTNQTRNWLYFTDIQFLPKQDLYIIDLLWKIYSQGKFGFSVQKRIWISNKKEWDQLWEKIKWSNNGVMRRYPEEFVWTLEATEGHLPLFNQLRGTQALAYLFQNIEW